MVGSVNNNVDVVTVSRRKNVFCLKFEKRKNCENIELFFFHCSCVDEEENRETNWQREKEKRCRLNKIHIFNF